MSITWQTNTQTHNNNNAIYSAAAAASAAACSVTRCCTIIQIHGPWLPSAAAREREREIGDGVEECRAPCSSARCWVKCGVRAASISNQPALVATFLTLTLPPSPPLPLSIYLSRCCCLFILFNFSLSRFLFFLLVSTICHNNKAFEICTTILQVQSSARYLPPSLQLSLCRTLIK